MSLSTRTYNIFNCLAGQNHIFVLHCLPI